MAINENDFDKTVDIPDARKNAQTGEFNVTEDGAQLVILAGPSSGRRFSLLEDLTIGRHASCAVWIPDDGISRQHAMITHQEDGHYIKDLDSKNGIAVNGLRIKEHKLSFGDKITLGTKSVLVFTYTDPLEAELLKSQKLETVGRLAAGVSHEFNNLLSVIVTSLTLLGEDEVDPERCQFISDAKEAATRGAELTRQMLDFSRSGFVELNYVDASALLNEVAALVKRTFGPNIRLEKDIELNLGVNGDRLQLYQALMNLCVNARDAVDDDGMILLRAKKIDLRIKDVERFPQLTAGSYISLEVSDSGEGMGPEIIERAFEPFFTTKKNGQGTGLGLSVAQGIVQSHNGAMSIDSQEGKGTQIRILLPYTDKKTQPIEKIDDISSDENVSAHILLVDDDELVARASKRALISIGCSVTVAYSGQEAIDLYEESPNQYDVVVLDVSMPGLSGDETFSILKELDPEIKVIIASGYSELSVKKRLKDLGIRFYLDKPFQTNALKRALLAILQD